MKIDYHVHLEEGPYSLNWWKRTAKAIRHFSRPTDHRHTRTWIEQTSDLMQHRLKEGAFSSFWLDFYLEQAITLGLKEVGVVDHLYRFKECYPYYVRHIHLAEDELGFKQAGWLQQVAVESLNDFISFIENEKVKWERAGVRLKLGIEADYFPGGEEELYTILKDKPWDYVIGSVHFLDGWGFDNPETKDRFPFFEIMDIYEKHYSLIEGAISCGLFDIIAHLDNLKVFGFRPDENELIPFYHRTARLIKKQGMATEINTGLAYRYPVKEMCPSPLFLKILSDYEVPITLSSDAHFPDDMGTLLNEASNQLIAAGFKRISLFNGRVREEVELNETIPLR